MALDLTSLKKAIGSLDRAITVANTISAKELLENEEEVIRAGVIQNFEFTYELCWKFIKRWLEENYKSEINDGFSIKELFRVAAEKQLIDNPESWFEYHRNRNQTSHVYDLNISTEVFTAAVHLLPDAKRVLERLEARND